MDGTQRLLLLLTNPTVASAVPVEQVAPVISGTPEAGQTLTAVHGTYTNLPILSYGGQWKDDGANIDGQTGLSLLLTEVQVGGAITYVETPTNAVGPAAGASTSNSLGPVTSNVTVPVLTKTTGTGVNPMHWTSDYVAIVGTDYITMRYRKDAGSWTEETPVLFDSNFVLDYGIDGVNYPWPLYTADTFAGGVVVDVQEGVKRDGVTYWSSSITETMASSNVAFTYGNKGTSAASSTAVSFTNCAFAGGGRALIALTCWSNAGGSTDSVPTVLTITPSAGGAGINCTKLGSGGRAASRAAALYQSDSDVTATNYDITGTRPNAARSNTVMWGTQANANTTPSTSATFGTATDTNSRVTASVTCPSGGLSHAIWFVELLSSTGASSTGCTLHDYNIFNSECGLAWATRATTGTIGHDVTPNTSYNQGRGYVAFDNV